MGYLQGSLGGLVSSLSVSHGSLRSGIRARGGFRFLGNLRAGFHVANSKKSCDPDPTRSPVE